MNNQITVIKVGTSILSQPNGGLDAAKIETLTGQICQLIKLGHRIVLVTSGAVGAGMKALGITNRPKELDRLQACAAVGQGRLMQLYEESFQKQGVHAAQILLTQEDFADRKRFINAKHTILTLMEEFKAVPVINENDTVATEEIRFGDNDRLAALVASLLSCHTLIILTDVDGLYTGSDKKVVPLVTHISREIENMAAPSKGRFGIGGMMSKLDAAKIAMRSGVQCIIANGNIPDVLLKIEQRQAIGTTFSPSKIKARAKKNWLAFSPRPKGSIVVDDGARYALVSLHKSLLAAGVQAVEGDFKSGDVVNVVNLKGETFAKGVVGFSSKEINLIKGLKTDLVEEKLRRRLTHNEVVHRDNLVIL